MAFTVANVMAGSSDCCSGWLDGIFVQLPVSPRSAEVVGVIVVGILITAQSPLSQYLGAFSIHLELHLPTSPILRLENCHRSED